MEAMRWLDCLKVNWLDITQVSKKSFGMSVQIDVSPAENLIGLMLNQKFNTASAAREEGL
jgi:hypothetical protein